MESRVFWKVYALKPMVWGSKGPRLIDESVLISTDRDRIVAYFLERIQMENNLGERARPNRYGASGNMVMLSVQKDDNPETRGRMLYCANTARKEKGNIRHTDVRVVLPATQRYGRLVAGTWAWWPSFWEGVLECLAEGDVTADQMRAVIARLDAEERAVAMRIVGEAIAAPA